MTFSKNLTNVHIFVLRGYVMEVDGNQTSIQSIMPIGVGVVYAEPVPDWGEARTAWSWAWGVHTYGLGATFLVIAVFMFITVTKLYSKCTNHKYVVTLNSMLLVCGLCRGLYLIVDPYGSLKVLPVTFSMVTFGVGHPCLTSAFSLLQWAFMRVTQVKLGPWKFPSYRALSIFLFIHFSTVISTNVIVSLKISMKLLLTLNETIFILWGFILCGIFIFKGFKITQFTSETQKALKQLSMYNQFKNDPESKRKELNIKRVKRPKIRITNDDDDTYSVLTDTTSGCSDSSISCHVTKFSFEKHIKPSALSEDILDEPEEVTLLEKERKPAESGSGPKLEIVMDEDTITVLDHSKNAVEEEDVKPETTNRDSFDYNRDSPISNVTSQAESNGRYFCDIEPSDTERSSLGSGSGSVYTVEEIVHLTKTSNLRQSKSGTPLDVASHSEERSMGNGMLKSKSFDLKHVSRSEAFTVVPLEESDAGNDVIEMTETDLASSRECGIEEEAETFCETGYMADTEYGSPKFSKRGRKQSLDAMSDDSRWGQGQRTPNHLGDANCSTISFHRIRQGKVLHKLVKVTYITTMFQFILCILQLYAMFGVYGVLGKDYEIDPWPWFTFQTCFRFAEIGMCATMSYVTFCLGKSRQKASERNRRKKSHLKDVKLGRSHTIDMESGSDG
ncbi:uncharacterized protein LOC135496596 [Lineus longissimus]|uniref:uncharacterized protein LOC135496596 n=1 Tax=Lineus longissimus TaxID=88925 RepID=UPI00315CEC5C